jgi:hypothetical protein
MEFKEIIEVKAVAATAAINQSCLLSRHPLNVI